MQLKNDTMLAIESEQARKKEREFIEPMQQTFKQFSFSVVVIGRFFDMALPSLSIYCTHLFFSTFQDCCQNIQHVFFRLLLVDFLYIDIRFWIRPEILFSYSRLSSHIYFVSITYRFGCMKTMCWCFVENLHANDKTEKRHISCCPIWVCLLSRIQFSST